MARNFLYETRDFIQRNEPFLNEASDLMLTEGVSPYVMIYGKVLKLDFRELTAEDMDGVLLMTANHEVLEHMRTRNEVSYRKETQDYSFRLHYRKPVTDPRRTLAVRRLPKPVEPSVSPANPFSRESLLYSP